MKGPGLLRRLFGRVRPERSGDRWRFGGPGRVRARPRGHSGVHSPRLQNADGAAFLVDGRSSGTRAPAARTARERRRIRRPADHDCRGLARGVRARTGRRSRRCPASQARLLPQHRYHVARTGGAGDRGTRPDSVVQVVWCVRRRSRATGGVGRRYRSKFAPELDRRFWKRARSRPGDAARHQPGSDDGYSDRLCAWFAEGNAFREIWRQDGMALMETQDGQPVPTAKSSLRVYRRNQHAHHSRRPGTISPRSPAALRALALRLTGGR